MLSSIPRSKTEEKGKTMKTLEEIEATHEARAAKKENAKLSSMEEADEAHTEQQEDDDGELAEAEQNVDVDQLQEELAQVRQQLSAMQGRVAPTQQRADEYRQLYEQAERNRELESSRLQEELNSLKSRLEEQNSKIDVNELLSEDERILFDEGQLSSIQKLVDATVKARVPKLDVESAAKKALLDRDRDAVNKHREGMLNNTRRAIGSLQTLASDPEFSNWVQDNDDSFDPLVRSFLSANTKEEVDRHAKAIEKRIAKFNEQRNAKRGGGRKTDAKTSLQKAAQRRPRSKTNEEISDKLNEAKRLARSSRLADRKKAKEILDSLE